MIDHRPDVTWSYSTDGTNWTTLWHRDWALAAPTYDPEATPVQTFGPDSKVTQIWLRYETGAAYAGAVFFQSGGGLLIVETEPVKKIGLVHGDFSADDYHYHPHNPGPLGAVWPNDFRNLWKKGGWSATSLDIQDWATWSDDLSRYDALLFTVRYAYNQTGIDWATLGSRLAAWLTSGKVLVIEGALDNTSVNWLDQINPAWVLAAPNALPGLPGSVEPGLLNPHQILDGWRVTAYYMGRLGLVLNPAAGLTVPGTGQILARNKNNLPTLWTDQMGGGRIFITPYFNGYALDSYFLEDLFRYHWGSQYEVALTDGPTIAEQVAGHTPPSGQSPNVITFDPHQVMHVNGQPLIPFGFYCVNRTSSLADMQSHGFNYSWSYMPEHWTYQIRCSMPVTWDRSVVDAQIAGEITRNDIVNWAILEEPGNTGFDNHWVNYQAALCHRLDPSRPTSLLVNYWVSDFEGYVDLPELDVIVYDPYYIYNSSSSLAPIVWDLNRIRTFAPGKPIWAMLQAHAFTPTGLVVPTVGQLRAETYTALAAGVKGIVWFALDDNGDTTVTFLRDSTGTYMEPQWSCLCDLATQMTTMNPYLICPDMAVSVVSPTGGQVIARKYFQSSTSKHLLIVANTQSASQAVTLDWPWTTTGSAKMFSFSPNITINGGRISLSLAGYGAGVYELTTPGYVQPTPMPSPIPTPTPASGKLTGTVVLQDYLPGPDGVSITVELKKAGSVVRTENKTLDSAGQFTLTAVTTDTYDVRVKASHWLAATRPGVFVSGNTNAGTFMLINGDTNGDNQVTFEDFATLQNHYGQSVTTGTNGDFNGDGQVTFADFAVLQNSYGQSGAASAPPAADNVLNLTPCELLGLVLLTLTGMGFLSLRKQEGT